MTEEDLVCRLLKFAQENEPGHIYGSAISDLLEEAATEIEEWRDCVRTNPMMEGPQFMGGNYSQMRRCWERFILRRAP